MVSITLQNSSALKHPRENSLLVLSMSTKFQESSHSDTWGHQEDQCHYSLIKDTNVRKSNLRHIVWKRF